jgi:hypothetical protein
MERVIKMSKKSKWQQERENAANLEKFGKNAVRLVLVSTLWNRSARTYVKKLTVKGVFGSKADAELEKDRLKKIGGGWYKVCGPRTFARMTNELKDEQQKRRSNGAKKAAKTKKEKSERGALTYILCPGCKAKSKLLYSEMGGLQQRRCHNGHRFEVDTYYGFRHSYRLHRSPF